MISLFPANASFNSCGVVTVIVLSGIGVGTGVGFGVEGGTGVGSTVGSTVGAGVAGAFVGTTVGLGAVVGCGVVTTTSLFDSCIGFSLTVVFSAFIFPFTFAISVVTTFVNFPSPDTST
ncbi:hypothetical protein SDC9_134011 [bioreactor metagenome]|uniref:Uncharacterized protein n=1 Tax=bioreactor metagenome TaxID=1076179 RepID=A0A645DD05_9ZZZZ